MPAARQPDQRLRLLHRHAHQGRPRRRRGPAAAPPGRGLARGHVFTEAERAALEVTEQGTRIADAGEGVTDEAWQDAAKHYDEEQLAALAFLVAMINAFNRINVITRQPAGGYVVGQFAG